MATNLVSVAMQFLTPDIIAKIASSLGLDRSIAQKAIGGAVPALFAVLTDVASTPNGARQLSNVVTQQQFGSLESLKGLMSGANPQTLAESGTSLLSGLFGNGVMGTLARSVGKFAGVGESSGNSILGVLGPVILGVLGQQQRLGGLDANGLASLLGSQKDHIAASLPSGLNDLLTSAGLFDEAEGKLHSGIVRCVRHCQAGLPARRSEQFPELPRQLTRQRTRRRRIGPIGSSHWPFWAVSPGMHSVARAGIPSRQRLPQRYRRRP